MITLNCHRGIMYTWALAAKRLHFFLLERGEENVSVDPGGGGGEVADRSTVQDLEGKDSPAAFGSDQE